MKLIVANPKGIEPIRTAHGSAKTYLIFGDRMVLRMSEIPPGTKTPKVVHPEEEIIYVLQGKLEYDDGRVVNAGEATINFSNVPHGPGKSDATITTIVLEVLTPSLEQWKSSTLLDILKQYEKLSKK